MIEIKPIEVPTKGIGKYFSIKSHQIDINVKSEATPVFYWEVRAAIPYAIDSTPSEILGATVLEGNIQMTKEEYSEWTSDDNYVIDWALAKLGFEKI